MMTVMVLLCVVVFVLLILTSGVEPKRTPMSQFELERRKSAGDKSAALELHREALLGDIISLQRIISALFLVIFVALSVATFGWLLGIIIAVAVALEYAAIARLSLAKKQAQKLYERYEQPLLRFVEKFGGILRFMRSVVPVQSDSRVDSRQELVHLVETSGTILSSDEKKLITHSLQFDDRLVSEIMTPRGVIDSISKREMLGPLVLDDLHKTGHSRFPVTDGDVDHVVGMLHIQDLLTIDSKRRSTTVEKAMEPRVFYIHQDQTLGHALAAFLRTHHHLFVVVNEFRETVGLLSLEDVIEALLGRKIIDEFDLHDDLRVVAKRNPRGNNHPDKREDV
jgi:magnesium and cobalt exporter, CNNM family